MLRSCVAVLVTAVVCSSGSAFGDIPKQPTGVPRFDDAIRKAVAHIREDLVKNNDLKVAEKALAGYTLLKAGVPNTDKGIRAAVDEIKKTRFNADGSFRPGAGANPPLEHIYFSGVMALLLAADNPEGNIRELREIAKYIISQQGSDGSWDYPQRTTGDTSMNQYGVLGLWACMRAGVKVPPQVWDKCLGWHVRNRANDGGWAYHPGSPAGEAEGASTPSMTYGAAGTMAICRLLIYPDYAPGGAKKKKAKKKLFGVLEETETNTSPASKRANPYADYKPATPIGRIDAAIDSAVSWCGTRFRTTNPYRGHPMYYYYAMERALAMNEVKNIGGQDWYTACGYQLLESQNANGSWPPAASHGSSPTCFGVLFLIKATKTLLVATYGNGIQVGDRGFDLDGDPLAKDKKKKKLGPLDEMLARMEQMQLNNVKDVPEEDLTDLVNKILQTPRKELVNHLAMLKKLRDYPRGDVRSVVMFGLGRSGDMRVAPMLIDALNDNDVGVLSEAHTALCYISRKPQGFGLKDDLAGEVEGLEQAEIDKIVNTWRKQAQNRWRAWYKRIRPYDERGDLWEMSGATDAKK